MGSMGSNPPELSLDLNTAYIPKTITSFLKEISTIGDASERLSKLNEYVKRLEDEMRKIDVFKRELPLCMLLLNDAIKALKEETMHCKASDVRSVMEEFIPLKRNSDNDGVVKKEKDCRDKKSWMSSVQLWSSNGCSNGDLNDDRKQKSVADVKEGAKEDKCITSENPFQSCKYKSVGGGAFMPFKGYVGFPAQPMKEEEEEVLPVPGLSLVTPGLKTTATEASSGLNSKRPVGSSSSINVQSNLQPPLTTVTMTSQHQQQQQQQQASRKQRRCWSPELHRRFVSALQQLGGSQVATPKQIRELMKVDGLTNDEVKSHLQKYRLHTRRSPATATPGNQPVVVLGGLWMSQDQYGASSKPTTSQSGSPEGPLQLAGTAGGISTTGGESMEDEEDEKSESYNWKVSRLPIQD
ncbi:transcription factor HHO5-like isoform X2 [Macadamia integrifolia]|uniref:transcription factor HHO5-like isoform X2 n=1 Tax=Macadamia integrifolia TaxID=60698 RepID=UPI001C4FCE29|nr:transcription factor HHO5-like isoform X2 [Macadamia integrifolia]